MLDQVPWSRQPLVVIARLSTRTRTPSFFPSFWLSDGSQSIRRALTIPRLLILVQSKICTDLIQSSHLACGLPILVSAIPSRRFVGKVAGRSLQRFRQ